MEATSYVPLPQVFLVSTLAGLGSAGFADGAGAAARFNYPHQLALLSSGNIVVADSDNNRLRLVTPLGVVTTIAGSATRATTNGVGVTASFNYPNGVAVNAFDYIFVSELLGCSIRMVSPGAVVTTVAGGSPCGYSDASLLASKFMGLAQIEVSPYNDIVVADQGGARFRWLSLSRNTVTTIIGNGVAATASGFPTTSRVNGPTTPLLLADGSLLTLDVGSLGVSYCVPCPASYFCASGAPVICPAGSYCRLSSTNALLCPKGSFSNAGASNCTLCPAGSFSSSAGSTSCQQCAGGHYCPAGASSWSLNCGRGNFCPDGSGSPTPCPYQVPPTGGWGALQVQGPAFLMDTARCLNHCFWNFTSGDGVLSKC